ncbi:MAG: hypothetical protein AAF438_10185 [Pseudomonadota bacterium]
MMNKILFASILFFALVSHAQETQAPESNESNEASPVAPSEEEFEPAVTTGGVSLDLDATSVTGNRELPKVLYIVPWRKAELGDLTGRPIGSLLDEVIEPIDPEVFQRQLSYYQDATSDKDGTSSVNSDVLKSDKFADNSE